MILFTIEGLPCAQKQTSYGNGHFYDPSSKQKEMIRWQMRPYAPEEPIKGPVSVDYTFFLPIPKSTSSLKKRQMILNSIHHVKKPDIDNLSYIVTNALKSLIIYDDSQICEMSLHKMYGERPRIVVKIVDLLNLKEEMSCS